MKKLSLTMLSLTFLGLVILITACQTAMLQDVVNAVPTETPEPNLLTPVSTDDEILITPTPRPTATPGVLDRSVAEISATTGLDRQVFLGLTGEDWINLGISVLIFIFGTLILSRIVYFVLRLVVRSTASKRDDEFFIAIRRQIDTLISLIVLYFATDRLAFISVFLKETLNQIYFALAILAIAIILWKLIDLSFIWQRAKDVPEGQVDHNASLRYLFRRFLRAMVVIAAVTIVLANYGINITFILTVIVVVVIALLIAGQDMLTDTIYGFILLFDQPFGVGDRIEIKELKTWGDVVEIGVRTTRVRTRDNRLVVYPNSIVGRSQVVNYSLPDEGFRTQIDFELAYGEDPEQAEAVIVEAVRKVDGVDTNKPIDVLLMKVSKSGLTFRLRWWMKSYQDGRYAPDKVLRSVYAAMLESGIELSLDAYDINIFTEEEIMQKSPQDAPSETEDG
jgi:small-conductance mechanosensitive channel